VHTLQIYSRTHSYTYCSVQLRGQTDRQSTMYSMKKYYEHCQHHNTGIVGGVVTMGVVGSLMTKRRIVSVMSSISRRVQSIQSIKRYIGGGASSPSPIANWPTSTTRFNWCIKRSKALKGLERILQAQEKQGQGKVAEVAVTGVAGAGKSFLAQDYLKLQSKPASVAWQFRAATSSGMLEDYKDLAEELGMKFNRKETGFEWLKAKIETALMGRPNFVLLFDNVTDRASIAHYLPSEQSGLKGQVILTTRNDKQLPHL